MKPEQQDAPDNCLEHRLKRSKVRRAQGIYLNTTKPTFPTEEWLRHCEEIADAFPKRTAMQAVADQHFNMGGFSFVEVRAHYYRWRNAGGKPAMLLGENKPAKNLYGLTPEKIMEWLVDQGISLTEWARRRAFDRGDVGRAFNRWRPGPTSQAILETLACDMNGGPGGGLAEREERARLAAEPPPLPKPARERKIKQYERLSTVQRAEIQAAPALLSNQELAVRYGVSDVSIRKWRKRDFTADRNSVWSPGQKWRPGLRKFTDADVTLLVETRRKKRWGYRRIAEKLREKFSTPMSVARVQRILAAHGLAGAKPRKTRLETHGTLMVNKTTRGNFMV